MVDVKEIVVKQKNYFDSQVTKELRFRLDALDKLYKVIKSHESEIFNALKKDLNKSEFDTFSTEIGILLEEISFMSKRLKKWIKPKKVKTALTHIGTKGYQYPEPYGTVLIIAPWNYPFQLAISPLIGAIAAGNCAVIKPSELTPNTSALIAKIISLIYPPEYITVVEGAVEVSEALLEEQFDYIFFTGSVAVGKVVMYAAAKHLTPVTLELGGKSPCIVHSDAKLELAAKRIVWGKFLNAGQTCIAPDYIYVHESIKEEFIGDLKMSIADLYSENPLSNPNYTRIVSEKHFARLKDFISDGNIVHGGKIDANKLLIEPTILDRITWTDAVMEDEIFGPILPVLSYSNLEECIKEIEKRPNPLALYLFSNDKAIQDKVIRHISFGGGCINDTVYHVASAYLPFGGKGSSGMGAYHGKATFDTFTHYKSILKQTQLFDIAARYPNSKYGMKLLKMLFK